MAEINITIYVDKLTVHVPPQNAPTDGGPLGVLELEMEQMMADLTTLTKDVNDETTVVNSAIALIQGLAAQITAAGTDPAALKALTDSMEATQASLAAAVAANTPAAPGAAATQSSTGG